MPPRPKRDKNSRRKPKAPRPARRRARQLDGITTIDTNDFEFLRQFVTEHGKILPSRLTGTIAKQQRQVKRGIRKMRVMGLVP